LFTEKRERWYATAWEIATGITETGEGTLAALLLSTHSHP